MKKTEKKAGGRTKPSRAPARGAGEEAGQAKSQQANMPLEGRIGAAIKRRRVEANLTLSDLSAGAGLSSAMLSRIENGMATASLDALERIAAAVGRQQAPVPVLAAQLDAWARARLSLARIEAAQCPPGHDPGAWAAWATTLTQLRFAPSLPDAQAALAALCETARGWKRHV